jgi:hypothetical protein
MRLAPALLALALAIAPAAAHAADEGLYAAPPPPGSAFVRFVNGDSRAAAATAIRGEDFHAAAPGTVGPYHAVQKGNADIMAGPARTTVQLKEGAHYSAVFSGGKLAVLEEPAFDPKMKAQLVLFNLSPVQDLSLKTSAGAVSVINDVKPGTLGARAVNAVKTGFILASAQGKVDDLAPRPLERGGSYAVVVYTAADGKTAVNYEKAAE